MLVFLAPVVAVVGAFMRAKEGADTRKINEAVAALNQAFSEADFAALLRDACFAQQQGRAPVQGRR
jgi:predicted negative regulator of RcsB-dependent stress response